MKRNHSILTNLAALCVHFAFGMTNAHSKEPRDGLMILDMVHHNPGEARYESRYEDPAVIKKMGYNGKVYFLSDAPTIAINWESIDPDIFPEGSSGRAWVDAKAGQIDAQQAACKAAGIQTYAQADLVLFSQGARRKTPNGEDLPRSA